jgi:hypothetical protein
MILQTHAAAVKIFQSKIWRFHLFIECNNTKLGHQMLIRTALTRNDRRAQEDKNQKDNTETAFLEAFHRFFAPELDGLIIISIGSQSVPECLDLILFCSVVQ